MSSRREGRQAEASSSTSRPVLRPTRDQDWEPYREIITELYQSKTLKEVMESLEAQYALKATTKQWKNRVKIWGLVKNIKSNEYMAMLKQKRQRARRDPNKRTAFRLRGKEVSPRDVSRFERRAIKKGAIARTGTLSDVDSIPDLECYTPEPETDPSVASYHDDDGEDSETEHADAAGSSYGTGYSSSSTATGAYYSTSAWSTTSSSATASYTASTRPSPMSVQSLISQPYDYQYEWPEGSYPDYGQQAGRGYGGGRGGGAGRGEDSDWDRAYSVEPDDGVYSSRRTRTTTSRR